MRINYPRSGRQGWRRFVPSWRLTLGSILTVGLAGVLLGLVSFAIAWATVDIPEENEVAAAQVSIVYWNDGTTEMARLGDTNRISVPLDQVPEHMRQAVLAAEDRSFYEHGGFAVSGFARALWTNLTTGSSQGGSTITQQYAKNAFLSSEKTYVRKFKELVLSLKLERDLGKDQILERYLNTIFFGRAAYGVQTAAEAYFGQPASELTLEQSAVLASIINAPGQFNPDTNRDRLEDRYAYVLNGMAEQGWISAAQRDAAVAAFPEIAERRKDEKFAGPGGHLLRAIQDEVLARGFTEAEVEGGGLRIVSTFDKAAQEAAEAAVERMGPTTGTEGLRIGLAAVEPGTGEVVALYGGADYLANSLNNATQAIAQAGSTFKPFALAAATEEEIGLDTLWPGNSPHTVGTYTFQNYGNNSYGSQVTLLRATEQSINSAYVELSDEVGVDKVRDAARRAGIPESATGWEESNNLTFVLGTASPHTIDVARAYATFAARGERADTTVVRSIGTAEGGVLYERDQAPEREFEQNVADVVNYALQSVARNGTGQPALGVGRPVAVKTGSTDEYLSAWFAGYTPNLAAAVSFSKDDAEGNPISLSGTGGMNQFFGSGYPARVWTAFMRGALEGKPVVDFVTPASMPSGGGGLTPTPTPTPTPTATATPEPSASTPTTEPTPEPTQSSARPTPEPTGEPTPSASPDVSNTRGRPATPPGQAAASPTPGVQEEQALPQGNAPAAGSASAAVG